MTQFTNNKNAYFNCHKLFVASFYLPLLYFQELVDYHRVHYNVELFGKIPQYLERFQLHHYRKVHISEVHKTAAVINSIRLNCFRVAKCPAHIRLVKYFFTVYLARSVAALVIRLKGQASRQVMIWLGHEVMGADGLYIETTFLMWGVVSFLFITLTLTDNLLDYKFLALNSMTSENCGRPFHPVRDFGLTERAYWKFARFRRGALAYFYLISGSVTPMGFVCVFFLHFRSGLYESHLAASVLYTVAHCYYIYILVSVIYYNLVDFVIVAYYIHVKQSLISERIRVACNSLVVPSGYGFRSARFEQEKEVREITGSLHGSCFTQEFSKLLSLVRTFSRLLDEVADYNAFWRSYLSFLLVIYVFLISFIIFICIFGRAAVIVNAAYVLILAFHIISVSGIIFFSGAVVQKNESIVRTIVSMVGRRSLAVFGGNRAQEGSRNAAVLFHLKMHNLSANLKAISSSGFYLLNGYLLTHDTFRLLAVNILIYFLLVVGSTRKLDQQALYS